MGIKVIGFAISTATLRVSLTLEELGLEYELEPVTSITEIKSPEFLTAKNPLGKVPVLIDDGFTLYESRAICRYLVNKYQGTKNSKILVPKDIQKASLVEQYLSVESLYFDIPTSTINYEEVINKYHGKEANAEKVKEAKEKLENTLDIYEKFLEGKDYLIGEYSLADICHVPNLFANIHKTSAKDIYYDAKRPNVVKWVKNLLEIPTWKQLGLEHEFEEGVYNEMKSPEFLATKNPFGKVPVMIDDGFTLFESRAICRYLVNKYQGTKNSTILIPKDIQKAALVEQYLSVESLYFDLPSSAINFEEIVAVKYMNREADAEKVKEAKEKIENTLDIYEKFLEGKDYLTGEYSLADLVHIANIYVNVHKTSIKDVYYDAKRPNVVKWVKRVLERPAWKQIAANLNSD
nr:3737_t:CDS:2 [Entrophospora candida]